MEALKEENLTLCKFLKESQEMSAALEDEWMRGIAETREMYERTIEGYHDQLQELQEELKGRKRLKETEGELE